MHTYNKIRSYLNSCLEFVQHENGKMYQKLKCCPEGYVEKSEIRWFSLNEILSNTHILRKPFLNSILKLLQKELIK